MRNFRWTYIIVYLVLSTGVCAQWCCLDTSLQIQDESTINLRLIFSGAVNNDLSSPTQGVCGVKIKFDHQFIGDLTMDLISPSGQRVRLIGPIGNSGNSSFSKWFVTFVPCGAVSVPDVGFKKKWDNIQSWGILGKFYSGTYYPQNGCLENFDSGSVNGTWSLSIIDDERFYQGKIESFCILFCDQAGINCQDCSSNGGYFNNTELNYCEGDSGLSHLHRITFPFFIPDDALYSYKYIVSQNDTIIEIVDTADLLNYLPGEYQICGVSYLRSDSIKLPVPGNLVSDFNNSLVLNLNGFCAELSKNCLTVRIHQKHTIESQNIKLCKGDSIMLGGQHFFETGSYNIPLVSTYGCDSSILLNLEVIDLKIIAGNIDTLDCQRNNTSIDLSASQLSGNVLIQWSTTNGNFSDLSNLLKPVIDKEGNYKVVFSDGSCLDSAEFTVFKKDDIPDLTVLSDTIKCNKRTVSLIARTDAINPMYNWSDGNTVFGFDSLVRISVPGLYFVTVTDENGCSNFSNVDIKADTIPPELFLITGVLSCKDTLAIINYTSDLEISNLIWNGPGSFESILDSAIVNTPGIYLLTAEALNGCISSKSIEVLSNKTIPDYLYIPDTLDCNNMLSITLDATSNSVIDSIVYTGPAGYYSNKLTPEITVPGRYNIHLTDTAACVLDTFIDIGIDTNTASFQLSTGILDCVNDSVQLKLIYTSTDTINDVLWTGPPGFMSNLQNPFTKEAGLYTVSVTSSNGCTAQDTISVLQDAQKPAIVLATGILDCNISRVAINATVANIIDYDWLGPNGFTSGVEDPVVQEPGIYRLIVTASNGCTSEKSIEVIEDRGSPIDSIASGSLNCKNDSLILKLYGNGALDSISWSGPGNFQSANDSIIVFVSGNYKVFAKGKNGCFDSSIVFVGLDTMAPQFSLVADTLSCINQDGKIDVISQDSVLSFVWYTPTGDTIKASNLQINEPGWYKVLVTSQNGCSKLDSIEILDKRNNPDFRFIPDNINCSDSIANISIVSNELLNYQWSGPGGFSSIDSLIDVAIPGWYHYSITNSFGCVLKDSFLVEEFLQKPSVQFSNPVFDCVTKSNPLLIANLVDSLELFEWILPSGLTDQNRSIIANEAGVYIFRGENKYGCSISDTLLVSFDTFPPVVNSVFINDLNCSRTQVFPLVETIPPGMDYNWSGPGNFSSQLPNPSLKTPGNYSLTITALNFCTVDTVINLKIDTIPPSIMAIGGEINCGNSSVLLDVQSKDSLGSVFWLSPIGTTIIARNPVVKDTGWYIAIVKGVNDCLANDSAYVGLNLRPPQIQVKDFLIPCDPDSVQISLSTNDSIAFYSWTGPNAFANNSAKPFVKDTGLYIITATGANLCSAKDSLRVYYNRSLPSLIAAGGSLSCKDSVIQLQAVIDAGVKRFIWSGPGLFDTMTLNPIIRTPGFYNIMITDSLGCKKDTTLEIILDTISPVIRIQSLDSLICEQRQIRLINTSACQNCIYQWSTVDGNILNQNKDTAFVNQEGNYLLKLQNPVNGCEALAIFELNEINSNLSGIDIEIIPPTCYGINDAQVLFHSIAGGTPPYKISFDNFNYSAINDLANLTAGVYTLYVKDRYGCLKDTLVRIDEPPQLTLSLGRDTTIKQGQVYSILPSTNANINLLQLITWNPDKDLNCNNCFNVNASPQTTTRYVLKITDENGCTAEDDIVLSLIDKPGIYIPNAFSVNGDNINDQLTLFSGEGEIKVKSIQVFDRWGNVLFNRENFNVLDKLEVWDFTVEGQFLNPGVYVYKIEILRLNGSGYVQAGDFTLLR